MQGEECHQLSNSFTYVSLSHFLLCPINYNPCILTLHQPLQHFLHFRMARPFTLSLLSLCVLLSARSCFGSSSSTNRFNRCQFNSLNALKPDHRVETDGGLVETWSSRHPELECAGVTATRRTLYRNGLQMPSYSPYSQMIIVIQGNNNLYSSFVLDHTLMLLADCYLCFLYTVISLHIYG